MGTTTINLCECTTPPACCPCDPILVPCCYVPVPQILYATVVWVAIPNACPAEAAPIKLVYNAAASDAPGGLHIWLSKCLTHPTAGVPQPYFVQLRCGNSVWQLCWVSSDEDTGGGLGNPCGGPTQTQDCNEGGAEAPPDGPAVVCSPFSIDMSASLWIPGCVVSAFIED